MDFDENQGGGGGGDLEDSSREEIYQVMEFSIMPMAMKRKRSPIRLAIPKLSHPFKPRD